MTGDELEALGDQEGDCATPCDEHETCRPSAGDVDWAAVQAHHAEVWKLGDQLAELRKREAALQQERRELEKRAKEADSKLHALLYDPIKANPSSGKPY